MEFNPEGWSFTIPGTEGEKKKYFHETPQKIFLYTIYIRPLIYCIFAGVKQVKHHKKGTSKNIQGKGLHRYKRLYNSNRADKRGYKVNRVFSLYKQKIVQPD